MEPFRRISAPAAHLDRSDVDTDQIIPKQFLKRIERTGFGEFLFHDWRDEDFYTLHDPEYRGAEVLVTGHNFGCGSSREHAPWALEDHGFRAIVAPSFADIFHTNCTKIGVLPVVLPEEQVRHLMSHAQDAPGAEVVVDLEELIVVAPDGGVFAFEIEDAVRDRLLNGWDDISITLNEAELIYRYEAEREREGPSTLQFAS